MSSNRRELQYSVSAISAPPRTFFDSLLSLEEGGVTRIHFDVMDGHFVPRFGLYPEFLREIKNLTNLPIDVHMMLSTPLSYIEDFIDAGASRIVPHVEPVDHLDRLVKTIKSLGVEVGLALNPHTDENQLRYVLDDLDSITVMAINPGIVGHKLIPGMLTKIRGIAELLRAHPSSIELEVDGGVTFENIPELWLAGAQTLVVGAGTIYHPERHFEKNLVLLQKLKKTT